MSGGYIHEPCWSKLCRGRYVDIHVTRAAHGVVETCTSCARTTLYKFAETLNEGRAPEVDA